MTILIFIIVFFVAILWYILLNIELSSEGTKAVNPYIYKNFHSVFTAIGILGTFIGIYIGLMDFDTTKIDESIPQLLEGLKTAFITSIVGIILSIVFKKISQHNWHKAERKENKLSTGDPKLAVLFAIREDLKPLENLKDIKTALLGQAGQQAEYDNLLTQIKRLRNDQALATTQNRKILSDIKTALVREGNDNVLTQIKMLRNEQRYAANQMNVNIKWIVESMGKNNQLLSKKFDEFSELLQKSNTEALVKVMEKATQQFNEQMQKIVEKLVQENFQELNNSVKNMIDWQQENKKMIRQLINQFHQVASDFENSSGSIKEIAENTHKLTNDNSHLTQLIKALQKVMIEDTKYQEIVNKLTSTIETLKSNTEAFDKTTHKLNTWVKNQMYFSDNVGILLDKLKDIHKIKDINEIFWNNTKKQLEQGVSLIKQATESLRGKLDDIDQAFYARLNTTFQNMDAAMQRIIEKYNKRF